MAVEIIPLLPKNIKIYCEPYFGGGAIFRMKPEIAPCEIINDVNANIINFYKVLKTRFPELKKKIELTL
ncbi:DNA adenine methylase, partial [Chryseobacterium sp. HMWF035]|uniref:DNA adenine methylase n=1 Tax=Chryseobacterium sp. HMWF035 TaxID=2056868 RepID=UPI0018869CAF